MRFNLWKKNGSHSIVDTAPCNSARLMVRKIRYKRFVAARTHFHEEIRRHETWSESVEMAAIRQASTRLHLQTLSLHLLPSSSGSSWHAWRQCSTATKTTALSAKCLQQEQMCMTIYFIEQQHQLNLINIKKTREQGFPNILGHWATDPYLWICFFSDASLISYQFFSPTTTAGYYKTKNHWH